MKKYPKRLIEVDLPIKRISAHARHEKNIRQRHIKNLHIWWARRPLAACRAVLCAALWPDPADELCPKFFREKARELMQQWADKHLKLLSAESYSRFIAYQKDPNKLKDSKELRKALLDFIADFADWDNSTTKEYLETSQQLTQIAHEELGGEPGTKPLVVDPFAGGGAIPLEALRVGADAYASDLNPVAVLLNKVVLEYIPKYGRRLADEVRKWGQWIKEQAEKELASFYPKHSDGAIPIAYLWARTIICEGPSCGAKIPMVKKYGITERGGYASLIPEVENKQLGFSLYKGKKAHPLHYSGNLKRGKVTCPICGWTINGKSVQKQLSKVDGGANTAKFLAVVLRIPNTSQRDVRLPSEEDVEAVKSSLAYYDENIKLLYVPHEEFAAMSGVFNAPLYGMDEWHKLYTKRQILLLNVFFSKVKSVQEDVELENEMSKAIILCLGLAVGNMMHYNTSVSTYTLDHMLSAFIQGQAIPMKWDFAEANPLMPKIVGGFDYALEQVISAISGNASVIDTPGQSQSANACQHPLPDDSSEFWFSDPPYYNSVPYADLSDLFLVWYSRFLNEVAPALRWKALYSLAYTAGLRFGELFSVTWKDIDFEKGEVRIENRPATSTNPPFDVKDHEARRIPLPKHTLDILTKLQAHAPERIPYILLNERMYRNVLAKWRRFQQEKRAWENQDMTNNVLREFKRHLKWAGIKPNGSLAIHTLRKCCGQNWADHIPNPNVVRELMGHSSLATTMKFYNQVNAEHRAEAAALIDDLLSSAGDAEMTGHEKTDARLTPEAHFGVNQGKEQI